MDEKVYNKLKEFEKDGIKLREVASWAVWDKDNINNLKIIDEKIDKLKDDIVFVGLNFSRETPDWENWKNFHCDSFADKRLRDLLSGTKYEGAYMTDLIKNYHNADPEEAIKNFKLDEAKRKIDIDFLFKEIDLLGKENIEMYLFGKDVEWLFDKFVREHENFKTFKQKIIKCQRIHHFSSQVTDFEVIASVQLGLSNKTDQLVKKWKYDPLW